MSHDRWQRSITWKIQKSVFLVVLAVVATFADEPRSENVKNSKNDKELRLALLVSRGKFSEALAEDQQLFGKDEKSPARMLMRYRAFLAKKDRHEAIQTLRDAVSLYPRSAQLQFEAGLFWRDEEPKRAVFHFKNAIGSDPFFSASYLELAKLARRDAERKMWCAKGLLVANPNSDIAEQLSSLLSHD